MSTCEVAFGHHRWKWGISENSASKCKSQVVGSGMPDPRPFVYLGFHAKIASKAQLSALGKGQDTGREVESDHRVVL